jgi:hypothetical protein
MKTTFKVRRHVSTTAHHPLLHISALDLTVGPDGRHGLAYVISHGLHLAGYDPYW